MSERYVEVQFPVDHVGEEAEYDPAEEHVSVEPILVPDVCEGHHFEALEVVAVSDVDREQYGEQYEARDEGQSREYADVSEEEVPVDAAVLY